MSWNNSSERQKFIKAQRKQAAEYKKLGMTDEQIKAMYEFDLDQFRSDRRFYSHTVQLVLDNPDDESDGNSLTITMDASNEHSRLWWIEELDDPSFAKEVKRLSLSDQELLSMCVVDKLNHTEISAVLGVSRQSIDKRFKKIELFLKSGCRNRVFAG